MSAQVYLPETITIVGALDVPNTEVINTPPGKGENADRRLIKNCGASAELSLIARADLNHRLIIFGQCLGLERARRSVLPLSLLQWVKGDLMQSFQTLENLPLPVVE